MADYHEMWKSLGMDLETHDQLCEVLPGMFGQVYLSQGTGRRGWITIISSSLKFTGCAPPN